MKTYPERACLKCGRTFHGPGPKLVCPHCGYTWNLLTQKQYQELKKEVYHEIFGSNFHFRNGRKYGS